MFQTEDIEAQRTLLNRVSELLDKGLLISTVNRNEGVLSVDTLRAAHEHQESGTAIGKTVVLDDKHNQSSSAFIPPWKYSKTIKT